MDTPQINVNIIRAFQGPRHSRLEFLWETLAEQHKKTWRLCTFSNPGARLSHAKALNALWAEELTRPQRYAIITEYDFLPDWDRFTPLEMLSEKRPIYAAEYCTRNPGTLRLIPHGIAGAWYVLVDKHYIKSLAFDPEGAFNDPANGLAQYVRTAYDRGLMMFTAKDCMPRHYGTRHLPGEHLFWSRHYNDNPLSSPAGFNLGDILGRHDTAVATYIKTAPQSFRALYAKRVLCQNQVSE